MTRTLWGRLFAATLMTAVVLPCTAFAQAEKKEPPKDAPKVEGGAPRAGDKERGARLPTQRTPRETLIQVHKLQETMNKEFTLSDSVKKDVDALFDAHYKAFANADGADAEQKEKQAKERMEQLRQEMKAASDANDRDKLKQLRKEMMEVRSSLYDPSSMEATHKLVDDVAEKLDDQQKETFRRMSERLGLASAPRPGGPLRYITQITREKDMGLTKEQDQKIHKIIRDHMDDIRNPDMEPAEREASMKKMEADVVAELTPEQKVKFEEKKAKILERTPPDRKGGKPGKGTKPEEGDANGKGDKE